MFGKVFFKSHPLKVTLLMTASAIAFTISLSVANADSYSSARSFAVKDAAVDQASLTSCIDKTGLANEIEITSGAMKKAANDVMGYTLKPVVEREEKVAYCALNLV